MRERKISVAVATYNGEIYLREQMDSILQNLEEMDEVICSDDGSSDATVSLIQEYCTKDRRVRLIQGPGKGIRQNIAAAIHACTGDVIFLADQDDVWSDDKVRKVLAMMEQSGVSLVLHDARVMDATLTNCLMDSFFAYRSSRSGFWQNFIKNRYMGCCMAFESQLKRVVLPIPDTIQMHDQWIGMLNDLYGTGTGILKEPLLLYRRHDHNVSDFSHGNLAQMLLRRSRLMLELVKRMFLLSVFRKK